MAVVSTHMKPLNRQVAEKVLITIGNKDPNIKLLNSKNEWNGNPCQDWWYLDMRTWIRGWGRVKERGEG